MNYKLIFIIVAILVVLTIIIFLSVSASTASTAATAASVITPATSTTAATITPVVVTPTAAPIPFTVPAVGSTITCGTNDPLNLPGKSFYRLTNPTTISHYPNPPIAASWDPTWASDAISAPDCSIFTYGPDMGTKPVLSNGVDVTGATLYPGDNGSVTGTAYCAGNWGSSTGVAKNMSCVTGVDNGNNGAAYSCSAGPATGNFSYYCK
jgi:hypothetical protein